MNGSPLHRTGERRARRRPGEGKNSFYDPSYWCFWCFSCGRKGTRDYMPAFLADREAWRERGSHGNELHRYLVVCRWAEPCRRRREAKRAAEDTARAA
ncbi:hypothetical protein ACWF9G_22720 [Nocardia sp. NPDC055029]